MSRTGTHTVLLGGVTTVRCSSATTTAGTCSIGPTGSCPTAQHPRTSRASSARRSTTVGHAVGSDV